MEKLFGWTIAGGGSLVAALNQLSVPLLGMPLTVITMAIGGALASFGYGERVAPKKKMYMLASVNAFLAVICVAVLPKALGWQWVSPTIEPPLAAMFAVGARFIVPQLIEMIPKILKRIFKLDEYRSNQSTEDYSQYQTGRRYYGDQEYDPNQDQEPNSTDKIS